MLIKAITRHDAGFDIISHPIDPAQSPHARHYPDYERKMLEFYKRLGIKSALWAYPENQQPERVEAKKKCEYVLEVEESRIVAYVNEATWSPYVIGKWDHYEYSVTPTKYNEMSLLIQTPICEEEVLRFRRYRCISGPDNFEVIEDRPWAS